jgi:hypothetical protein
MPLHTQRESSYRVKKKRESSYADSYYIFVTHIDRHSLPIFVLIFGHQTWYFYHVSRHDRQLYRQQPYRLASLLLKTKMLLELVGLKIRILV